MTFTLNNCALTQARRIKVSMKAADTITSTDL